MRQLMQETAECIDSPDSRRRIRALVRGRFKEQANSPMVKLVKSKCRAAANGELSVGVAFNACTRFDDQPGIKVRLSLLQVHCKQSTCES